MLSSFILKLYSVTGSHEGTWGFKKLKMTKVNRGIELLQSVSRMAHFDIMIYLLKQVLMFIQGFRMGHLNRMTCAILHKPWGCILYEAELGW